jgi:hypothetical protein
MKSNNKMVKQKTEKFDEFWLHVEAHAMVIVIYVM